MARIQSNVLLVALSLKTWLAHSRKKTCDICKYPYSFEKGTCRIMLRSPAIDMWFSLFTGHAGEVADLPPPPADLAASIQYGDVFAEGRCRSDCVARHGPVGNHMDMADVFHLWKLNVRSEISCSLPLVLIVALCPLVPGGLVAD